MERGSAHSQEKILGVLLVKIFHSGDAFFY